MKPAARVQAAIEILDEILEGAPAERALTAWARRSRFAGSKDRAAIRDHVYDVLRRRNSCAQVGGSLTGRGLMVGLLALQDHDLGTVFAGDGYGPAVLSEAEMPRLDAVSGYDLPDWALPELRAGLGADFDAVEALLKERAPVVLRCNLGKTDRAQAIVALAESNIQAEPHPASDTALTVTSGARQIAQSEAYKSGLVELQDSSSQAAIQGLPLRDGMRVLDYCAGGGGKLLAMAARIKGTFVAHDAIPRRMQDLPVRAKRAGIRATCVSTETLDQHGPFDLVFADVPCSGSGSWRRDPDGKWRMTQPDFQELLALQASILRDAAQLVGDGGTLVYATCSMCRSENKEQVQGFLSAHPDWHLVQETQWTPLDDCDGFFAAVLQK
ncbi:RsmB/NOP family class I SAM-dependent RNA methyltransferase [Cognatishimia sp.]|uniref:RsmB/NOP family class I SAM-dependent RNA methyltransferase n=1 Tax=Cognatishimia sp. TaxID=2211648 RepID=UPI003513C89B